MADSSNNPYKSGISGGGAAERIRFSPRAVLFSIGAHVVAMVIMVLMLGSCFVTYAPSMTAAEVQNAMLRRMLLLALSGFGVQVYGIAVLVGLWRRVSKQN